MVKKTIPTEQTHIKQSGIESSKWKEGRTCFIYGYMTWDIWSKTIQITIKEIATPTRATLSD